MAHHHTQSFKDAQESAACPVDQLILGDVARSLLQQLLGRDLDAAGRDVQVFTAQSLIALRGRRAELAIQSFNRLKCLLIVLQDFALLTILS